MQQMCMVATTLPRCMYEPRYIGFQLDRFITHPVFLALYFLQLRICSIGFFFTGVYSAKCEVVLQMVGVLKRTLKRPGQYLVFSSMSEL